MRRHLPFVGILVAASGCALSPVVDPLYDASEPEPSYESDAEVEQPPSDDEPEDKAGVAAPTDEEDAAADAGAKSDAGRDAGSAKDAGPGSPRDAGRVTAPSLPVSRAGEALSDVIRDLRGRCNVATDCKTSCVPVGILNCCRADKTCGCTWAPGAYCL